MSQKGFQLTRKDWLPDNLFNCWSSAPVLSYDVLCTFGFLEAETISHMQCMCIYIYIQTNLSHVAVSTATAIKSYIEVVNFHVKGDPAEHCTFQCCLLRFPSMASTSGKNVGKCQDRNWMKLGSLSRPTQFGYQLEPTGNLCAKGPPGAQHSGV